jgi:hypothetical protein
MRAEFGAQDQEVLVVDEENLPEPEAEQNEEEKTAAGVKGKKRAAKGAKAAGEGKKVRQATRLRPLTVFDVHHHCPSGSHHPLDQGSPGGPRHHHDSVHRGC